MKIVWHSEAPWLNRAYGQQTALWADALLREGHEVFISSFGGHAGTLLHYNQLPVAPPGQQDYGADSLPFYVQQIAPAAVVVLCDPWVLGEKGLESLPKQTVLWTPVDQQPLIPLTKQACKLAGYCASYSRWGVEVLRAAGFDPFYLPLAFDSYTFYSRSEEERGLARQRLGVQEDVFFAVCVGANTSVPSRKSLDRLIQAWAKFVVRHPHSMLYLHCCNDGREGGFNLEALARQCELPRHTLAFPDVYGLFCGQYGGTYMADLYAAANVVLLPSAGEGFGLPLLEAQACGCPVVTTNYGAMRELCFGGYKIPVDPLDDLIATQFGGLQVDVRPSAILEGLEWAFENVADPVLQQKAIEGAQEYTLERGLSRLLEALTTMVMAGGTDD